MRNIFYNIVSFIIGLIFGLPGNLQIDIYKIADLVLAVASVFISGLAIWFTKRSLKMQREHNKKSVKPIPNFIFKDHPAEIHVLIQNSGFGPMIIESLIIIMNGKEYHDFAELFSDTPHLQKREGVRVNDIGSAIIPPGSTKAMLDIVSNDEKTDSFSSFSDLIKKVNIKITYTDVYGREFNSGVSWDTLNSPRKQHSKLPGA